MQYQRRYSKHRPGIFVLRWVSGSGERSFLSEVRVLVSVAFMETSVHFTLDRSCAPDCGPPNARLWSRGLSQGLCPHSVAAWLSVLTLQKSPSDTDRVSGEASQPQGFKIPPKFIFVGLWRGQTPTQLLLHSLPAFPAPRSSRLEGLRPSGPSFPPRPSPTPTLPTPHPPRSPAISQYP